MKKYTVKKHGDMFVDTSEPVICPECGELVEHKGRYDYESDWVFFDCFLVRTETTDYICDNCKCQFCEDPEMHIVEVDWHDLSYIIILTLCILLWIVSFILWFVFDVFGLFLPTIIMSIVCCFLYEER